jgi:hypothetical protein
MSSDADNNACNQMWRLIDRYVIKAQNPEVRNWGGENDSGVSNFFYKKCSKS